MTLDFVFSKKPKNEELLQGDILQKTPALRAVVQEAHAYYAKSEDYHYFMILTQSCDLVKRGGRKPRSRYITLAAIRPLEVVVEREIERFSEEINKLPIKIYKKENEQTVKNYLERLINNTQERDGLFFIRKGSHEAFTEDYCVHLYLSIAIRSAHYDECVNAKVAQLDDVFQAKVGWLTGNLYSRVGTPDIADYHQNPDQYKKAFYEEVLSERAIWLSSEQRQQLKKSLRGRHALVNEHEAKKIIGSLRTDIEYLAERIVEKLAKERIISEDEETKKKAILVLANDKLFKRLMAQ